MWAKLVTVNEHWTPMAQVVIEAFNIDSPTTPLATVTSDNGGVALFTDLPSDRIFFKPRATRASSNYGSGEQTGIIHIQILDSSGPTCADAYVDPTGHFGTDKTIQAAITRLASKTGNVNIFIAGGTYAENLTTSSNTAIYTLQGCGPIISGWPLAGAFSSTPLSTKINGAGGVALTSTGSANVILNGVELYGSSAGAIVAPNNASMGLKLVNCYVHNDGAGDAILSTVGPVQIYIDRSIVKGAVAVGVHTTCTAFWAGFSWLLGKVNGQAATGLAEIVNCFTSANNATNAVDLKFLLVRILGCTMAQTGAGNGIALNTANGAQVENCELTGGAGTGITTSATTVANLSNNVFASWTTGVNINATALVTIRGHTYITVTTPIVGKTYFVGCRAYNNNTAQTINNNAVTTVKIDAVSYDPLSSFNVATFTYTVPITGKYHMDAAFLLDLPAASAGHCVLTIAKNGGTILQGTFIPMLTTGVSGPTVSGDYDLVQADAIVVQIFQVSGGNVPLLVAAGGFRNYFNIHLLQQ